MSGHIAKGAIVPQDSPHLVSDHNGQLKISARKGDISLCTREGDLGFDGRTLVVYGSRKGLTKKIAVEITNVLTDEGFQLVFRNPNLKTSMI
jgi:hypothetical protein